MKTRQELEQLYNTTLKNNLASLEGMRKKLMGRYIIAIACIVVPFGGFMLMPETLGTMHTILFAIGVALILFGVIFIFLTKKHKRAYRNAYKQKVVAEIVKLVDDSWAYEPDNMISQNEYHRSELFRQHYDRYKGDDFISGKIDKTEFKCSELHTEYETTSTDSDGKSTTEWHTIFQGLFFHADFNKEFSGKTYIAPDFAEKTFGKWGQKLQKGTGPAPLVKLEDPEFEKQFVVHSTDQIEARYILTPTIMEAMTKLRKDFNVPLNFSFIGNRIYCAMSFSKELFEPKIMRSGVKFEDVENMFNLFSVNETIIKELNLNTRIWTKD